GACFIFFCMVLTALMTGSHARNEGVPVRGLPDCSQCVAECEKLIVVARTDPQTAMEAAVALPVDSSSDYLAVAGIFAVASSATSDDVALAEHRAARAVLYVRHALEMGADKAMVAQAKEFESLRQRKDFRQAVAPMLP